MSEKESLSKLTEHVRTASGVRGETLMEQMQQRSKDGKEAHLNEEELNKRIFDIEQNIDQLHYRSDMERSLYLMLVERMRLRGQMRGKVVANPEDPQFKKDLEVLQDLERRITYWQYEEAALDEILDAVEDYEVYRTKYRLNRPQSEGGVPRDAALEAQVAEQLKAIHQLLPKINRVRALSFYEWKMERDSGDAVSLAKAKSLRDQLPENDRSTDVRELASRLKLELRVILGTPAEQEANQGLQRMLKGVKEGVRPKVPVPKPLELMREALWNHFDRVLQQRKALVGDAAASEQKNVLQKEHMDLLGDACTFNMKCIRRRARVAALLAVEGHFGQPVGEGDGKTSKFKTGPLTEADRKALDGERRGNIEALEHYLTNFREHVLREKMTVDVPLVGEMHIDPRLIIEDLETTHVIPFKMKIYEKDADIATLPWGAVDLLHETLTFGLVDSRIREWRKRAVLQPILERLGLPENYQEMSSAEQKKAMLSPAVQDRIRSVKTIIDSFKIERGKQLNVLLTDVQQLKKLVDMHPMPQSDSVIYSEMPNISALKTDEELAGAMQYLIQRIEGEHLPALDRSQRDYITKIAKNMDLHIDVADVDSQLGFGWMREWAFGGASFLTEIYVILEVAKRTFWGSLKGLVRSSGSLIRPTAAASTAERVVEGASRTSRVGRILGPLGIVLIGADLHRDILRDTRLQVPQGLEAIDAAIEMMENMNIVNTKAPRHPRELQYLKNRKQSFVMEDGSIKLAQAIQRLSTTLADSSLQPQIQALQERCESMRKNAKALKRKYERLFPATDYLVADPKGAPGNIGINIRKIDEARERGRAADGIPLSTLKRGPRPNFGPLPVAPASLTPKVREELKRMMEEVERAGKRTDVDSLSDEYGVLLEDGADLIEKLQRSAK